MLIELVDNRCEATTEEKTRVFASLQLTICVKCAATGMKMVVAFL